MKYLAFCRSILLALAMLPFASTHAGPYKGGRESYEIRVYHFTTSAQEQQIDSYLKNAYLPALHRQHIANVGVFKPIANDTTADKRIYVLVRLESFEQSFEIREKLKKDADYQAAGGDYLNTVYNQPAYVRMESILLRAFPMAPAMQLPALTGPKQDRVFELRSYESPSEKLHINKVQMFNEGGEVALFKRLEFNAVFYAEVVSGSHMPNLMYMTSFENIASRDQHWKTFSADPEWKRVSGLPEYQHNVSHSDIILMHSAEYSDI